MLAAKFECNLILFNHLTTTDKYQINWVVSQLKILKKKVISLEINSKILLGRKHGEVTNILANFILENVNTGKKIIWRIK